MFMGVLCSLGMLFFYIFLYLALINSTVINQSVSCNYSAQLTEWFCGPNLIHSCKMSFLSDCIRYFQNWIFHCLTAR